MLRISALRNEANQSIKQEMFFLLWNKDDRTFPQGLIVVINSHLNEYKITSQNFEGFKKKSRYTGVPQRETTLHFFDKLLLFRGGRGRVGGVDVLLPNQSKSMKEIFSREK